MCMYVCVYVCIQVDKRGNLLLRMGLGLAEAAGGMLGTKLLGLAEAADLYILYIYIYIIYIHTHTHLDLHIVTCM
jgi:hypothetical protein